MAKKCSKERLTQKQAREQAAGIRRSFRGFARHYKCPICSTKGKQGVYHLTSRRRR